MSGKTASATVTDLGQRSAECRIFGILAVVVFLLHLFLVTRNWDQGLLPGHEFRQTQTALSIAFIEQDDDFSIAYPTPLFGPPWSIPMEFPLYQWSAAWLAGHTGWSIPVSGRAISLACFYLCLPAVLLLLREFKFSESIRLGALILVLSTPVYIFYTRAVLIESMALMFSLWFVLGFVRMCRLHSWPWMIVASTAATAASLVKVTSMMAWCIGPALGGLWWSWREWKRGGWIAWRQSVWLGFGSAMPAGLASIWWLRTADEIKANSPGGGMLTSQNLTDFNLGHWSDRIDVTHWMETFHHIAIGVTPLSVFIGTAAIAIFTGIRTRNWQPLTPLLWFLAAVNLFPLLYRIHDYYFYAIAVLVAVSIATSLQAITGRFRSAWLMPALVSLVAAAQLFVYHREYYPGQKVVSNGGSHLTYLLRDVTDPDEVIIVLGDDWSSTTAYYSRRRCFMVSEVMMHHPERGLQQLESLATEKVAAMVAMGYRRENDYMIGQIARRFDLESTPIASNERADIYLARSKHDAFQKHLALHPQYGDIQLTDQTPPAIPALVDQTIGDGHIHDVSSNQAESVFAGFSPRPSRYRAQFGFSIEFEDNRFVTGAHPDCDLWVISPPNARRINLSFGIRAGAYADSAAATDGVAFIVSGVSPETGEETELFRKFLNPARHEADRGTVHESFELPTPAPAELIFSARPGASANYAFDWAYWSRVDIN